MAALAAGTIFFGSAMQDCRVPDWVQEHGPEHDAINNAIIRRMGAGPGEAFMKTDHVQLPPVMRPAAGGEQQVMIRWVSQWPRGGGG